MGLEVLSQDEIETILEDNSVGILSLADEGESYATPESFGYDGEYIHLHLVYDTENSMRTEFLKRTTVATFTVYDEEDFTSVVVRGPIKEVTTEKELESAGIICSQTNLPSVTFDEEKSIVDLEMRCFKIKPYSLEGRRLVEDDDF